SVAAVENEPGRDGHGQRGDSAHLSSKQWFELQCKPHARDADKHDRQTQRPDIASKQTLKQQENVKVKRAVIVGWVVAVKPVLHHLIDEPAVDALVEMGRLDAQEEKAQERCQHED